jgi:hypothetical protein
MLKGIVVTIVVSFAAVASTANAATVTVGTAAPPVSLSAFALGPADFDSGASVASNRMTSVSGLPTLVRVFHYGARLRGSTMAVVVSVVMLEPDAPSAAADFASLGTAAHSAAGREALAKEWGLAFVRGLAKGAGKSAPSVKRTVVGAPVEMGSSALRMPITVVTNMGTVHMSLGFVQGDRVLTISLLIGPFGGAVSSSAQASAVTALQHHVQAGFTIANTAAPSIGGTVAQGQTLTAAAGSWAGSPSELTYSWSRCDATGGSCTSIAGATGPTYVVGTADAGFTLQVTVTAANSISTGQAVSAATVLVA